MGRTMPSNSKKVLYRGTKGMRTSFSQAQSTASWASTMGLNHVIPYTIRVQLSKFRIPSS